MPRRGRAVDRERRPVAAGGPARARNDAGVEEIAAALARPIIAALADPSGAERDFQRVVARVLSSPPPELREWLALTNATFHAELFERLRRAVPGLSEDELRFRADSVAGILRCMVGGGMAVAVEGRSPDQLEGLLVPVIAGALAGSGTA